MAQISLIINQIDLILTAILLPVSLLSTGFLVEKAEFTQTIIARPNRMTSRNKVASRYQLKLFICWTIGA